MGDNDNEEACIPVDDVYLNPSLAQSIMQANESMRD